MTQDDWGKNIARFCLAWCHRGNMICLAEYNKRILRILSKALLSLVLFLASISSLNLFPFPPPSSLFLSFPFPLSFPYKVNANNASSIVQEVRLHLGFETLVSNTQVKILSSLNLTSTKIVAKVYHPQCYQPILLITLWHLSPSSLSFTASQNLGRSEHIFAAQTEHLTRFRGSHPWCHPQRPQIQQMVRRWRGEIGGEKERGWSNEWGNEWKGAWGSQGACRIREME